MITHRCKNCIWWDNVHPMARLVSDIPGKSVIGFCRKHKPGVTMFERYYVGVQPIMDADEFCGEFREEKE